MEEPHAEEHHEVSRKSKKLRWTHHHLAVYVLTFMGYACYHATRKTFSNVKTAMSKTWMCSLVGLSKCSASQAESMQGMLDSVFMISYAVGLYISGYIGDRFNVRYVLSIGMCSSAVCVFMFGTLTEWLQIYHTGVYVTFWVLNGLLQSSGWPSMVRQ